MSRENTFLVGDWLVKPDGLSLQNKHQYKDIDAKVMHLLAYLITHRERVVSRNELLDELWKNQVVADDVLNVAMSSLRKALGDDFKKPKYIKTLPRKGYQLIAPVKEVLSNQLGNKLNRAIVTFFLFVVTIILWLNFTSETDTHETTFDSRQAVKLAVLPFDFYSSVENREYIADGLTEAIINQLVQEPDLLVTSRASVMQYKVNKVSIKEVVEQLDVEWILEGSVQLEGDKIQVTAQLINAVDDTHLWSETYQRNLSDILKIQGEFASEIVTRLNLSSKQNALRSNGEIPAAAYDRFLQAQYFHYQGENEKAMHAYQQAIELYPMYAQAYAHLALDYFSRAYSSEKDNDELINKASTLAKNALQLDPHPAMVQLAIALTYLYKDHDHQRAGQAFKLAFSRNNQDLMLLEWFAEYLLITKQFDKAEQLARHMVASSPLAYNKDTRYRALYYQGDFKAADKEVASKTNIISAGYRESLYAWNALASGDNNALLLHAVLFLKELKVAQSTIDEFIILLQEKGRSSALSFLVEKSPMISRYDKAKFSAWAGDSKQAIHLLTTLVAQQNIQVRKLAIEPAFSSLVEDPNYLGLLKNLNLEAP